MKIKITLEDEIRGLLSYDHNLSVDSECAFGDHWSCSCGANGLDSGGSNHIAEAIMEVIKSRGLLGNEESLSSS